VTEAEVERAKAQLRASLLLSLDSTTPVAEDIGRQLVTTGRRMSPEEIEKVVGSVSVADVRRVANEKLWDQDLAISACTFSFCCKTNLQWVRLKGYWITRESEVTCPSMHGR
jgi:predicted Zn-dependent peptidase